MLTTATAWGGRVRWWHAEVTDGFMIIRMDSDGDDDDDSGVEPDKGDNDDARIIVAGREGVVVGVGGSNVTSVEMANIVGLERQERRGADTGQEGLMTDEGQLPYSRYHPLPPATTVRLSTSHHHPAPAGGVGAGVVCWYLHCSQYCRYTGIVSSCSSGYCGLVLDLCFTWY